MSLNVEWFGGGDTRDARRDIEGVSIAEAERDLAIYSSSIGPVAIETAGWMYKNWSVEQFFQLPVYSRVIFLEIIEREILPSQMRDSEKLPSGNKEQIKTNFSSKRCEEGSLQREPESRWYRVIKREMVEQYLKKQAK